MTNQTRQLSHHGTSLPDEPCAQSEGRGTFCLVIFFGLICYGQPAVAGHKDRPQWIWATGEQQADVALCLRNEFATTVKLERARLWLATDFCHASLFVNGRHVAVCPPFGDSVEVDITEPLRAGSNTLVVCCQGVDGPSALAARLKLFYPDGRSETTVTDGKWQSAILESYASLDPKQRHDKWQPVETLGPVAEIPGHGDSGSIKIDLLDDYTQWKQALGANTTTDPSTFQIPENFEVRLIRSAADGEDSWVSLTSDERGRWIVAKEKRGLLRFTLNAAADRVVKTETINDSLAECRGLLVAHGSLYAMANNDKALYRLRNTEGSDQLDDVRRLAEFQGDVGHGRNQITLGPDGMIYGIFGDAVFEPESELMQVPRVSHPNRFEGARSGFVARTDTNGRQWEVVSRGLRNPFGIDFNQHGEMFTYDADAEYDMGSSWYRPTRILHLLPGGDYGWRRVTRQWPPYFPDRPDMPQPTFDCGKGSPTAVAFGTQSHFPWPYRDALFVLDWAYGRILAVHLSPRGSSYRAQAETFIRGMPLNVTDVEFGADGAMYFVTGGRGTQSALYRVSYVGPDLKRPEPTRQQLAREQHSRESRQRRRRLESLFHVVGSDAVEIAWPQLKNADPWIRGAARTVIEWQSVESWRSRALSATDVDTALAAWLALVRVGDRADRARIAQRLNRCDLLRFTPRQKQEAFFLYERCLEENAPLSADQRTRCQEKLMEAYPAESFELNRRLSLLVSEFGAPDFVGQTMQLLMTANSSDERFHYLYSLRNAEDGWTPELRESYFRYLQQTAEHVGGEGMPRFRKLIASESLATVRSEDRDRYTELLKTSSIDSWQNDADNEHRDFVRNWTVDDFGDSLNNLNRGRDLEQGKRVFSLARCIACHRVGQRGGVQGPDLTSVSGRFAALDLLTAILEPSKIVSENYRGTSLILNDGQIITGRIVASDYRSDRITVIRDSLDPDKVITIRKSDVQGQQPSPVSPMPKGLLDTMSKDEILDLLAWLLAGGR